MKLNEAITKAQGNGFVYLDKNFTPAEVANILSQLPPSATPVSLLPKSSPSNQTPFSISFLLQCYIRCLGRSNHFVLNNNDPVRLLKTLIMFYRQFRNVDLKQLVPHSVSVEMTLLMSMPSDLEPLMEEAVKNGVEDEDALEDAVVKILQYRIMFGHCIGKEYNYAPAVITGFKPIVDQLFDSVPKETQEQPKVVEKPQVVVA